MWLQLTLFPYFFPLWEKSHNKRVLKKREKNYDPDCNKSSKVKERRKGPKKQKKCKLAFNICQPFNAVSCQLVIKEPLWKRISRYGLIIGLKRKRTLFLPSLESSFSQNHINLQYHLRTKISRDGYYMTGHKSKEATFFFLPPHLIFSLERSFKGKHTLFFYSQILFPSSLHTHD